MKNLIHLLDLGFQGSPETIASFLIDTDAGPVLVETGPHSTLSNLEAGIHKAGFDPLAIKHVFVTHIHLDHAGAAWAFAQRGATIYVHPAGVYHLSNPERLLESARRIYKEKMDQLWGTLKSIPPNQVVAVDHGGKINLGSTFFQAWHTPGHAVHHIAWQFEKNLFAGDVAGVKIESGPVVPPCPPPDISLEDWENSINLIQGLDVDTIWLTHFGKVDKAAMVAHFSDLRKELWAWADWMKPQFEKGIKADAVVPDFMQFVEKRMRANGCPEELIPLYEYANPSWMSVAGLLRYWKKKLESSS